jgi:hypothetical protein
LQSLQFHESRIVPEKDTPDNKRRVESLEVFWMDWAQDYEGGNSMNLPFTKFYWRDWQADTGLRACSLSARGLWVEMLAIMAQNANRYGYLEVGGKMPSVGILARLTGAAESEVAALMEELLAAGVPSLEGEVWYSRRLVREGQAHEQGKAYGKKGGSPLLKKEESITNSQSQSHSHGATPPLGEGLTGGVNPTLNPTLNHTLNHTDTPPASRLVSEIDGFEGTRQEVAEHDAGLIYEAYPRKGARKDAIRAIIKAFKQADATRLLELTMGYAEARRGQEPKFTPYASTWYNGERWQEPESWKPPMKPKQASLI